jgi:hypothetical protein
LLNRFKLFFLCILYNYHNIYGISIHQHYYRKLYISLHNKNNVNLINFLIFLKILYVFIFINREYLKISEALAAVTLLAVANGAGDVITALVASNSDDGISYNIGSLYGAGLFCTSLIIAVTIKNSSKSIVLYKGNILRDVGLYIVATIFTLIFALTEKITVLYSLIFLFIYVVLVIIVLI